MTPNVQFSKRSNNDNMILSNIRPQVPPEGYGEVSFILADLNHVKSATCNTNDMCGAAVLLDDDDDDDHGDLFSVFSWSRCTQDKQRLNQERCKYDSTRRTSYLKISRDVMASVCNTVVKRVSSDDGDNKESNEKNSVMPHHRRRRSPYRSDDDAAVLHDNDDDIFSVFAWSHCSQDKQRLNQERREYESARRKSCLKIPQDVMTSVAKSVSSDADMEPKGEASCTTPTHRHRHRRRHRHRSDDENIVDTSRSHHSLPHPSSCHSPNSRSSSKSHGEDYESLSNDRRSHRHTHKKHHHGHMPHRHPSDRDDNHKRRHTKHHNHENASHHRASRHHHNEKKDTRPITARRQSMPIFMDVERWNQEHKLGNQDARRRSSSL